MAGVKEINVSYNSSSTSTLVREQGGYSGGKVQVTEGNRLAQPVKNDINSGIAQNPGNTSMQIIDEWLKESKDRTEYQYDSDKYSSKRLEGEDALKDSDGNQIKKSEVDEMAEKDKGAGGGAVAFMAVASVIAQVMQWCKMPFGATAAAIIYVACSMGAKIFAKQFDKNLQKRESYAKQTNEWIKEAQKQAAEINDTYERFIEDRTNRFNDTSALLATHSSDYSSTLSDMNNTLLGMYQDGASKEEIDAYKEKINKYQATSPTGNDLEMLGEIQDEGYDEYYELLAYSEGMANTWDQIKVVLNNGKKLGIMAATCAAMSFADGMPTALVAISKMIAKIGIGDLITLPARMADTALGSSIAMMGAAGFMMAGMEFSKTSKTELYCDEQGNRLLSLAITPLRAKIASKQDLDSVLTAQYDDTRAEVNGVIADMYQQVKQNSDNTKEQVTDVQGNNNGTTPPDNNNNNGNGDDNSNDKEVESTPNTGS